MTQKPAGLYLYAIIPCRQQIVFDLPGMNSKTDDPGEVYTLPYRNLAAVVSSSPLSTFAGLKRSEAAYYLVAHQRVVETLMQNYSLLPVKFGTVLRDSMQVQRLLAQGQFMFQEALTAFNGKVQVEIVVLWEVARLFASIAQQPEIESLKHQIAGHSPEETLPQRIEVGRLVQQALGGERLALQQEVIPAMQDLAEDMIQQPLMDDSMALNVALLVNKPLLSKLEERLNSLDRQMYGRERYGTLTFRSVGPLPLYSFASVEVTSPGVEAVEMARLQLGLPISTSPSEIKSAYRRQVVNFHPDHCDQANESQEAMTRLNNAYHLLAALAGSQAQWKTEAGDHFLCDFSPSAVESTLLVSVRRQEPIQ